MSNAWNPDLYLKFQKERTQPAIDLCKRIDLNQPKKILDIGCGPGNSTKILRNRWPASDITGIDNSPEMIDEAKAKYPNEKWFLRDASNLADKDYDLIFSNAAIHWIPDHHILLPYYINLLNKNGILAVQIPNNIDAGINIAIENATYQDKYKGINFPNKFEYKDINYYYEILCKESVEISIWETNYIHILDSHNDIVQWYKSTGLKGYLSCISDENIKNDFENTVLQNCQKEYKIQPDNKVLYSFNRLFFIAKKK